MQLLRALGLALALVGMGLPSMAQERIVIGQTAAFTGSPAANMRESTLGAKLVFDDVNAKGGINGQLIELVSMDDEFKVPKALENAKVLIREKKAVAIFMNRGTPHSQAMLPLLAQHGVPLIAPSTGAMALHTPVNPYVFNVRSTYQLEAEKVVSQLGTMGIAHQIGLVYVDDSFGQDALIGALKGFAKIKAKPVFQAKYDRITEDIKAAVELATKRDAAGQYPAVLIMGSSTAAATLVKMMREAGSKSYVATLSNNASAGFGRALGGYAEYVIVSQVFPKVTALHIPLVRETAKLLEASKSSVPLTPAMLEGAAGAKLLVAALRKCQAPVTSKRLLAVLESGTAFDIGWPDQAISYSPTNHTGTQFADTSIFVDGGSKFRY